MPNRFARTRQEWLAKLCVCGHVPHGSDGKCLFEPNEYFSDGCTWCPGFQSQLDTVMEAMLDA